MKKPQTIENTWHPISKTSAERHRTRPKSALSASKFPFHRWTGLLLKLWTHHNGEKLVKKINVFKERRCIGVRSLAMHPFHNRPRGIRRWTMSPPINQDRESQLFNTLESSHGTKTTPVPTTPTFQHQHRTRPKLAILSRKFLFLSWARL